jgi:WD40 repeated domain
LAPPAEPGQVSSFQAIEFNSARFTYTLRSSSGSIVKKLKSTSSSKRSSSQDITKSQLHTVLHASPSFTADSAITCVLCVPELNRVFAGHASGAISMHEAGLRARYNYKETYSGHHPLPVLSMVIVDHSRLWSACAQSVHVFSIHTNALSHKRSLARPEVNGMVATEFGVWVAAGKNLFVYSSAGRAVKDFRQEHAIVSLAMTTDRASVFCLCASGDLSMWDASVMSQLRTIFLPRFSHTLSLMDGHRLPSIVTNVWVSVCVCVCVCVWGLVFVFCVLVCAFECGVCLVLYVSGVYWTVRQRDLVGIFE